MFDIGIWELSLIAIVALIVIGPERLPKVARTVGMWIGRGQKIISSVKEDIDRELKAEELKKVIEKQGEISELHDLVDEMKVDVAEPLETEKPAKTGKAEE